MHFCRCFVYVIGAGRDQCWLRSGRADPRRRPAGRLQIVFTEKAHPQDHDGKEVIRRIHAIRAALNGMVTVAYPASYDMGRGPACLRRGGREAQYAPPAPGSLGEERHEGGDQMMTQYAHNVYRLPDEPAEPFQPDQSQVAGEGG